MSVTLILGAGIFGASTAYHLSLATGGTSADRTILLDRASLPDKGATVPSPAASWDWNKIVRSDYNDEDYARIMKDGMEAWKDPSLPWKPFFVQSGLLFFVPSSYTKKIAQSFEALGNAPPGAELISVDEAKARGWFPNLSSEAGTEVWWNPNSGYGMAKEALAATVLAAVEKGVEYVQAEVSKLKREGENGRCVGVVLDDGSEILADKVVVCLGAGSVRLLEASGADVAVGDRMRAQGFAEACITSGLEQVDEKTRSLTALTIKSDWDAGGFLPAGPQNEPPAKFYHDIAIRRDFVHPVSGSRVSAPPYPPDYAMWDVTQPIREMMQGLAVQFFGEAIGSKVQFDRHRICWDLSTRNNDFVISSIGGHGGKKPVEGLFMATGGSFHGFKFLPVIGRYVIDMMDGKLEDKLAKKWSWESAMSEDAEGDWSGGTRERSPEALGFQVE